MRAEHVLVVEDLTQTYRSGERALTVLANVSFSVAHAETCAIVGPSGSGKTTLLGLCAGLDPEQAFPALIQEKIDQRGWDYEVVNAGVSGDTTASGLRRIDWLLRRPVDVLFLELGGNDGLRGIAPDVTRQNLQGIIDKTRARNPEAAVVVAGMLIPPNMGPDYFEQFRSIFPEIAGGNDALLIPFLLEGVAGDPELNLPDGIHPTAKGHRRVAEHVWGYLEPLLVQRSDAAAAGE